MSAALLLFRRELRTTFRTPLLYLVGTPLLVGFGWAFYSVFVGLRTAELARYFQIVQYLLIVGTPILGMRTLAEERRAGTADLLLVRPIGDSALVAAKFAGVVLQQLLLVAPMGFYIVVVNHYGHLDGGAVVSQAAGTLLGGALLAAVSVACSSMTRSQVVAAAFALAIGFVQWFADVARGVAGRWIVDVVAARAHLESFQTGILGLGDVVYFMSWTALWLLVARAFVMAYRWSA